MIEDTTNTQRVGAPKTLWFSWGGLLALTLGLFLVNSGYMRWRDDPFASEVFSGTQSSASGLSLQVQARAHHRLMWLDATMLGTGGLSLLTSIWFFDRKGRGL